MSQKNKSIAFAGAGLCVAAAVLMHRIGSSNGHLTELLDFFWVPLPLATLLLILGFKSSRS